jgi:hypothetical protein
MYDERQKPEAINTLRRQLTLGAAASTLLPWAHPPWHRLFPWRGSIWPPP